MADAKQLGNVGSRKAAGTVKQTQAFGFDKVGDAFAGTYVGTKLTQIADSQAPGGMRDASLIVLQPDNGDKYGVWSNKVLDDLMAEISVGTFVKITHTEVGKAKGKKQGAKLFEITTYA
jgi:hypothetical protein